MARTEAYGSIAKKRPTASLVSKKVLSSFFGLFLLQVIFQVGVFFGIKQLPWYFISSNV